MKRRSLLSSIGLGGLSMLAGCSGYFDRTTGVVWHKQLIVTAPLVGGGSAEGHVFNLVFSSRTGVLHGEYDPTYIELRDTDGPTVVTKTLHQLLTSNFRDVRYHVGIDPGDSGTPMNAAVTREDFNRVALGGHATASEYWGEGGRGYLRLHETSRPQQRPAAVEIRQFDLDTMFSSER